MKKIEEQKSLKNIRIIIESWKTQRYTVYTVRYTCGGKLRGFVIMNHKNQMSLLGIIFDLELKFCIFCEFYFLIFFFRFSIIRLIYIELNRVPTIIISGTIGISYVEEVLISFISLCIFKKTE